MDKFKDAIPFSAAAPIAILGVPFDNVTTAETLRLIDQMVASRRPHYLATANVDFIVQAAEDVELRRILFDAHLVLCDGTPLVWASRILGNPLPERVAGSDLLPILLQAAAVKGYRPFFLGATPDSIEQAVAKVKENYPGIEIAGYYSPPFNRLLEMDHEEIRNRILRAAPDLLFVGFGCPKQEKWIYMHYRSLGVPVSVGVGGTIDFLAGRLARAPHWMRKSGTEWLFRLSQEPRRLLGRYSKDLWHFGTAIAAQTWRLRAKARRDSQTATPPAVRQEPRMRVVELSGRLDFEEVHQRKDSLETAVTPEQPCVMDLRKVDFIDSTGVGLLIRLQKRARLFGQQLILAGITENVRRSLQMMRLEDFFVIVPDLATAEMRVQQATSSTGAALKASPASPFPCLAWNGELTAANAEEIWVATMDYLAGRALSQQPITIDLAGLQFIDSTGLSIMIRARKYANRQGLRLRYTGAAANILNVIRLSRLEDYLLKEE